MTLGQNTGSAEELMAFVERRERLESQKRDLGDDIKVVNAEIEAAGFDRKTFNAIIKIRKAKPHDLQEAQALLDTYLHALGMAAEPPLARFVKNAAVDRASLDSVIAYMEPAVPPSGGGHIDVNVGGRTWRLTRDLFGAVTRTDVTASAPERKPSAERPRNGFEKPPVPDVDEAGARALGKDFALQNRPVIDNPFPFGDARRAKFDEGWRDGAGGDGMGPDEDD
jgi:uncharacterized protein (UPF0335 family)